MVDRHQNIIYIAPYPSIGQVSNYSGYTSLCDEFPFITISICFFYISWFWIVSSLLLASLPLQSGTLSKHDSLGGGDVYVYI